MTCATIAFCALAQAKPRQQRIFHYITAGNLAWNLPVEADPM
jgi:hypothetical protein